MGLYARLKDGELDCPRCAKRCCITWQFYFGEVSDLPTYAVGDRIRWDNEQRFGNPSMTIVYAIAYPEDDWLCPICKEHVLAEIPIINGIIEPVCFLEYGRHKKELLYIGRERRPYYILYS